MSRPMSMLNLFKLGQHVTSHILFHSIFSLFFSESSPSPSSDSVQDKHVRLLLTAVEEYKNVTDKRKRWKKVAEFIQEKGVETTAERASNQYRSLKFRYYKAKSKSETSGEGSITFKHWQVCNEHFNTKDNLQVNPESSCSTLTGGSSSDEDEVQPPPAKQRRTATAAERMVAVMERAEKREEERLAVLKMACEALQQLAPKK